MNAEQNIRFRYAAHTRHLIRLTIISAIVVVIAGSMALLIGFRLLPINLDGLLLPAYIIAMCSVAILLLVLILQYGYAHSGVWIEPDKIRVRFPGTDEQEMVWSEALFAVDEGEEYLRASKGKEGVGFLFGERRYVRLFLEGMMPEQRAQCEQVLAEHVPVRRPLRFTLMTLLNSKGELVARGRLYLFDDAMLCAENRGEKRVFLYASLIDLDSVKQRASFYVGNMECEAFTFRYRKEYVVMLGYETTFNRGIGSSSHWSVTGNAAEWVEDIEKRKIS
ncbi:MAG TPA: hypothetical protein VN954_02370 [Ktedonobacteraceae bacterium]|nr:hypothetical protein [Ktedonobacteraceae bacterium]